MMYSTKSDENLLTELGDIIQTSITTPRTEVHLDLGNEIKVNKGNEHFEMTL